MGTPRTAHAHPTDILWRPTDPPRTPYGTAHGLYTVSPWAPHGYPTDSPWATQRQLMGYL